MYREAIGWAFTALLISSSICSSIGYPNGQAYPATEAGFYPSRGMAAPAAREQQHQGHLAEERKFAEKPNAVKKVALDDLDDIQTNQISESGAGGGFSWSSFLGKKITEAAEGMLMQMIFNPGGANQGPNKSEGLDDGPVAQSPWANLLSVGLKILTAILGGGHQANSEGIDKVDNGGSPLQFINIVVNLLDALKTSFSHRSMAARNLGKKDSISDATIAGIAMAKGYVRSMGTGEDKCMQKYLCEATSECSDDIGQNSMFCHLGSYAVSFLLDKTANSPAMEVLYEAARRGRYGNNCKQQFLECNEV